MYSPEGFTSFLSILDTCDSVASEFWSVRIYKEFGPHEIDKQGIESPWKTAKHVFFERDLFVCWMFSRAITSYPVHLCSPTGHRVIASYGMLSHEDQLDWYEWSWPASQHDELSRPLNLAVEADDIGLPFKRFRFIDPLTGTVSVSTREEQIREFAKAEGRDREQEILVASSFDGWALCYRDADIQFSKEKFILELGLTGPRFVVARVDPIYSRGRPRLQEQALNAYFSAFPAGHGSTPWKVVETRVSETAGRSIGEKTIRRAIGQVRDNMDQS